MSLLPKQHMQSEIEINRWTDHGWVLAQAQYRYIGKCRECVLEVLDYTVSIDKKSNDSYLASSINQLMLGKKKSLREALSVLNANTQ